MVGFPNLLVGMHFNFRRRKVTKAAIEQWPSNNIPTFRNNKKNKEQLDHLVEKLVPECQLPCFGKKQIRRHVLDWNGHDYSQVHMAWILFFIGIYSHLSRNRDQRNQKTVTVMVRIIGACT